MKYADNTNVEVVQEIRMVGAAGASLFQYSQDV
jgi:hypothetical protein